MYQKPSMNPAALRSALVIIGSICVALGSAPLGAFVDPRWLDLLKILGGVLVGKELLRRTGDYAPEEVTLLDDGRPSAPSPAAEGQ
jgi:hypothetical protein